MRDPAVAEDRKYITQPRRTPGGSRHSEETTQMIEALKSEEIVHKVGGRFKLTALIQRRMVELMQGARPLVERKRGMTDIEVAIQEILEDKIAIDYAACDIPEPSQIIREKK
jgi:DNA-directed RNA polymerase subunit omega